jgi:outer membrane beta-barrel protein
MGLGRVWGRFILAAVLVFLPFAAELQAQNFDHGRDGVELVGFGGVYRPGTFDFQAGENAFTLDETRMIFGARLGYVFAFNLFMEASFAYTPQRMTLSDSSLTNLDTFIGDAVIGYNLQIMKTGQLFILAGGGVTQWNPKNMATERQIEGVFGGGLRVFITPGLGLQAEVRDHVIPKTLSETRARLNPGLTIEDQLTHNLEITAGVTLFFGTNRDADEDRVFNNYDTCPSTPAGVFGQRSMSSVTPSPSASSAQPSSFTAVPTGVLGQRSW